MKTILITGGSGLVGRKLSRLLIEKGYKVIWLSRERYVKAEIPRYRWDYRRNEIDKEAVEQADVIIHLAGSNLGEDSWTRQKKQSIVESRVQTAQLLLDTLKSMDKKLDAFISASAIGFYGVKTTDKIFTEKDASVESDFLSRTCRKWEDAAFRFQQELDVRTVALRTAFVISKNSDAFRKMVLPTRFGLGAPIGSGNQYMSWIHIEDLCQLYLKAIEDTSMQGAYNAVAPEFINNADFMHALAKVMRRPFFMPHVPAFFMRLIMGEAADMILGGSRISAQKIQDAGYEFQYDTSEKAFKASLKAIKEKEDKKRKR
ncbi:TIGR01777 family oxidoreductase [Petrimonas sp.]|uniref:TIGR01777 family oxidoreductase n=1 Tax=Petrimonas sp. TaxID=2023866 RepID=UPI003F51AA74